MGRRLSAEAERAYHRDYYHHRREQGVCPYCGNLVMTGQQRCESCREKQCKGALVRNWKLREEVFRAYGGYQCQLCTVNDPLVLTIDHIEGKKKWGHDDKLSGVRLYAWLKRNGFPAGFRVLCMNCNYRLMILKQIERRSYAMPELTQFAFLSQPSTSISKHPEEVS